MGAVAVGVAGAAIGAGASIIGSSNQASATTSAQNSANATQLQEQQNAQKVEKPYVDAGNASEAQQQNLLGLNGTDAATKAMGEFTASPGYAYQVQQGLSAIDNGAASTGSLRSGNTIRAEEGLGSNLANQDFGNYYNRLQALTSVGASAATQTANNAVQTGQGIAGTDASAGNQLANIYGNESSGIGNSINNGLNSLATLGGGSTTYLPEAQIPSNSGEAGSLSQAPTVSLPAYNSDTNI